MSTSGVNNCYFVDPKLGVRPTYSIVPDNGDCGQARLHPGKSPARKSSVKPKHEDRVVAGTRKRARLQSRCSINTSNLHCPLTRASSTDPTVPDPSLALFRKSSRPPAKKYTRPPTKKVFESLKITPEEWVRLEREAKAYMLNAKHPERQGCVGNRSIGPTNDTKINLFKTVQKFLENDIGERFFGRGLDAADTGNRWVYPRDETLLISHLTPLMRRMVTNERQRQYARRTRAAQQQEQAPDCRNQPPYQINPNNDSSLQAAFAPIPQHQSPPKQRTVDVFFLLNEKTLLFRHSIADTSLSYAEFRATTQDALACYQKDKPPTQASTSPMAPELPGAERFPLSHELTSFDIKVQGPQGLESVDDELSWDALKLEIEQAAWMVDGPMKVLVHLK